MKKILLLSISLILCHGIYAQVIFKKSFAVSQVKHVVISNISGPISVTKSNSKEISIKVTKNGKDLDPNVSLDLIEKDNAVIVYLRTPCTKPKSEINYSVDGSNIFGNWESNCNWNSTSQDAFSLLEFEVSIPENVDIYAQTILNGDIEIKGATGDVYAQNVNGAIHLEGIMSLIKASTVNGDIDIEFVKTPLRSAEISTINGEVNIKTIANADFNATFKSFQGDLYTDHKTVEVQPLKTAKEKGKNGFKLTMSEVKSLTIGKGGPVIAVETFNGDAYLIKK
jgi:DUF4097 and DUF4098 domain-containing protein YvlB